MATHLAKYIDHTVLKPTTVLADVEKLCNEARQYRFAAVCVPPYFVSNVKEWLENTAIKIATVIGFPFGYNAIEAKVSESLLAISAGADELDMVINLSALKNHDWNHLLSEINEVMPVIHSHEKILKIIIESGVLTDDEIVKCCELYGNAGVHFMKTSTGYAEKGASVHAVKLMRSTLPSNVKIKASGGIKTYEFAQDLIDAGADRLGCSASVSIIQTIN